MPHTTTPQEIKNFFGHIEKIQTIQDTTERNQAINSIFGESLGNNPTKLESLYILFSEKPQDKQYQQLLIYATFRVLLEQNGLATEQATKLYTLFNKDINKIKKYLCDYAKQNLNSPEPMHDACNFAIPFPDSAYTSKIWSDLSAKYLTELPFRQLLAQAPEIEVLIKIQAQAVPYTNKPSKKAISDLTEEINTLNSSIKKRRARASTLTEAQKLLLQQDADTLIQKKAELTTIGIPFNNELSLTALTAFREKYVLEASASYKQFLENGLTKKDHEKFMGLVRQDDDTIIPPLIIDGATIEHPGYYLMKVPVMDEAHAARAAYFGKLTNCCQSLSGEAGEPCVIHGLTSPNGGFYVICHGDCQNPQVTDEVIGQSWVWRGKENALVFDSIEITDKKGGIYTNRKKIVNDLVHGAAKLLGEQYNVDTVLCGANSGISKKIGLIPSIFTEQFKDYQGYSDSTEQLVLRDKRRPFYFFETDPQSNDLTDQLLNNILNNKTPLVQSKTFEELLKWAVLSKNINLIQKTQKLASQKSEARLLEVNNLISNLEEYVIDGLTPHILSEINKNLFFPYIYNMHGHTALMQNMIAQNTESVLKLIQTGVNVNELNIHGAPPLLLAVLMNKSNYLKALIAAGANLEHVSPDGKTVLMIAAEDGRTESVRTLIKAGANLEHKNNEGKTVLMYALEWGDQETIKIIEKALKKLELKKEAIQKLEHSSETKSTPIEPLKSLPRLNTRGETALMQAIDENNITRFRELIESGADLEQMKERDGNTALILAARAGQEDFVTALIKAGANLEHVNKNGNTALHLAIGPEEGSLKALIEAGANVNHTNNKGVTVLMSAALYPDSVRALLQAGANVELTDNEGKTVLMYAIEGGDLQTIEIIEEALKELELKKTAGGPLLTAKLEQSNDTRTTPVEVESEEPNEPPPPLNIRHR